MCLKVLQTLLCYIIVCVIAFEDIIYVYGEVSQEMVEQGRRQYQLLQERGNLPHYGNCWKSAVEHVEEGCRTLSEETQSDMALHITNCFLEMSGHETYNCELDKKPNLKAICIRSMTDRAFNVYTEFYTHTQNICWFLRGQVWHETIAENTLRVGKQLESSAKNQERILTSQKESLNLQEKLMRYGQNLEKIMEDFYVSTKQHQEILSVMSTSLRSLQSWLVGEISWFELIVFYVSAAILIVVFTSVHQTAAARLPIWVLLGLNAAVERLICSNLIAYNERDAHLIQGEIYDYVWWSRKIFVALSVLILVYKACQYRDMVHANNTLLQKIYNQNVIIAERIEIMQKGSASLDLSNSSFALIHENGAIKKPFNDSSFDSGLNGSYKVNGVLKERVEAHKGSPRDIVRPLNFYKTDALKATKHDVPVNKTVNGRQQISPFLDNLTNGKYNLRSRQGTPTSNV